MLPQIGDFIAIASLAAKAVNALDSSRGSKFEFTSLLHSLKALGQAMLRAEALCMECHTSSFDAYTDPHRADLLNAIASDVSKERKECEALVSHFLTSFKPYHAAFAQSHNGKIHRGFKELTWMWRKEEAAMLERRLDGHVRAMQLHLWTFYQAATMNNMAGDRATLESIESSVRLATAGVGDVQHKMSEALVKLDTVQKAMPSMLGYFWASERPVLLLDGLGRKTPLPMMLVCSPEIFRDVLLIMHRNGPGYDKIESGKYVVSDEDSGGALVPRERWLDFLQPGKRIGLSFIMKHQGTRDEKQCPRCRTLKTWWDDHPGQRRCLKCHLTYKVEDRERARRFWKDLKVRPRRPNPPDDHSSARSKSPRKPKGDNDEDSIKRPLKRQGTLDPEDYDHPYLRVHYQRDVPSRGAVEQPWKDTDTEFEKFLAALPPIHRAAATGNVEKLDEFLGDGDDGDAHWEVTDSLFRHDRTGWDFAGAPPIHFAAYYGHTQAVLFLLSWLVDIDGRDAAGTTALHAAAWTGNEKLFKLLLRKGADKTICDSDGWSATIYAVSQGHDNIPRLLIDDDSDGDVETLVKMSKLRHAAKLGNMEVVLEMLLEDQATTITEEDNQTRDMLLGEALIGAAEGGHEELTSRLLDSGADPAATDSSGSTAIHWASWGGHTEIENQRYDQDGNAPSPTSPTSPISRSSTPPPPYSNRDTHTDSAEFAPTPVTPTVRAFGHESVIAMLMGRGANVNTQNSQGCTALHWVAGAGSRGMVQWLLELGADVTAEDSRGRRAVERAKETGDEVVINMLVRAEKDQ